jgi:hypothetical protein
MHTTTQSIFAALTLALCGTAASAGPALVGTVTDSYVFPTSSNVFASSTIAVGTPTVCPGADPICSPFAKPATLSASGLTLSVSEDAGSSYTPASFNGIQFSNLVFSDGSHLTGFTLDTDLAGLTASDISFTGNSIEYNAAGLNFFTAPYHVTIGLITSSASVPEPASWALMLGGFSAIGSAMRSRRKTIVSFG